MSSYTPVGALSQSFQTIVTTVPVIMPATIAPRVVSRQNSENISAGPSEAPRPPQANRTSQNTRSRATKARSKARTPDNTTTYRLSRSFCASSICASFLMILS